MRARNIKPGFYKNEQLAECSFEARLLFPGLWMLADREGRLEYRPKRMKAEIFPFDNIDIPPLISELSREGLVILYEVNGKEYIWIPCFLRHQTPHIKEKKSEIPPCKNEQSTSLAPDEHSASTSLAPDETGKGNSQNPLNPESLILNPESTPTPTRAGNDDQFLMIPEWEPSKFFETLAKTSGVIPPTGDTFNATLGEFKSYWLTQKRKRTQHEWELAFIKSIKSGFNSPRGKPKNGKNKGVHSGFDQKDYGESGLL